jgi:syntaxin-binding protein 5
MKRLLHKALHQVLPRSDPTANSCALLALDSQLILISSSSLFAVLLQGEGGTHVDVAQMDAQIALHYGIPYTASLLAFDPVQRLLALATLSVPLLLPSHTQPSFMDSVLD